MSSDPEDFEDWDEPPKESLEGILIRILTREYLINCDQKTTSKKIIEDKDKVIAILKEAYNSQSLAMNEKEQEIVRLQRILIRNDIQYHDGK